VPELRRAAFAVVVLALLGALAWTTAGRPRRGATQARSSATVRLDQAASALPSPPPAAGRHAARRFVEAFLSYEVAGGGAAAPKAIRAGADDTFARELISHSPPPTPTDPRPARIEALRVAGLPGRPHLALVSGTARRPSGPEPFAFLFARRQGRWLAVAPGE
jgi:hypothetical protein